MMLVIPSSLPELTQEIKRALLLAKQQGFVIDDIELSMSLTQMPIIQQHDRLVSLSTNLLPQHSLNVDADFSVLYPNKNFVVNVESLPAGHIYVGVNDDDRILDIWRHPLNNEIRALSSPSKVAIGFEALCHFAWVVTLLALDFPIEDCLTLARAMVNVSRETWASDFSVFPVPLLEDKRLAIQVGWPTGSEKVTFPTLTKSSLGLYPVVDSVEWIERLLLLGVNTIQLRIKDSQQPDLEQQIIRAIELGRKHNAQVFINDYWQLAIKHGAYGVHLGQEDIESSNLSHISRANICLGLSTHGYYELLRIIQIHPSYIALGHIFPTTTKKMPSKPQGLIRLGLYQKLIDTVSYSEKKPCGKKVSYGEKAGFPTVAIGGIDQSNAEQVWQSGVSSLAVVRAITLSDSPAEVVEFFKRLILKNE